MFTTRGILISNINAFCSTYDDALGISETRRIKTKSSADLLEEMTGQLSQTLIISEEQLEILDVPLGQGNNWLSHNFLFI